MGDSNEEVRRTFLRAQDEAEQRFGQMNAMVETLRCALSRPDIEAPSPETLAVMLGLLQKQVRDAQALWESFAARRLALLDGGAPPGGLRLV